MGGRLSKRKNARRGEDNNVGALAGDRRPQQPQQPQHPKSNDSSEATTLFLAPI